MFAGAHFTRVEMPDDGRPPPDGISLDDQGRWHDRIALEADAQAKAQRVGDRTPGDPGPR